MLEKIDPWRNWCIILTQLMHYLDAIDVLSWHNWCIILTKFMYVLYLTQIMYYLLQLINYLDAIDVCIILTQLMYYLGAIDVLSWRNYWCSILTQLMYVLGCVRTGSDNVCVRATMHARVKIWGVHTGSVLACVRRIGKTRENGSSFSSFQACEQWLLLLLNC